MIRNQFKKRFFESSVESFKLAKIRAGTCESLRWPKSDWYREEAAEMKNGRASWESGRPLQPWTNSLLMALGGASLLLYRVSLRAKGGDDVEWFIKVALASHSFISSLSG